jgi:PAS domain S-box-containing protein
MMRPLSRKSKGKDGPEKHPSRKEKVRPEDTTGPAGSSSCAIWTVADGPGPTVHICGENPGALHVVDRDLRIVAFNESFEQWNRRLGLETQVLGKRLAEVFPFLVPGVYEEYRRVFDQGQILISEERNRIGDTEFLTETHKIPVIEGKIVTRVVTIVRDITTRKAAEEAVAHYQAQLKALTSKLTVTEERERRRLATELHDRITQGLAISKLDLQSLLATVEEARIRQSLGHVIEDISHVLEEIQALTSELSSPILSVLGLETAVAQYLKEVIEKRHRITTEFKDDRRAKPLDEDTRLILFRDIRELLINVVKHARANKVTVSISRDRGQVRICVEDDGIGFEQGRMRPRLRGGFGLLSIQEGVEQFGGRLSIQSGKNQGTKVTLTAPLGPVKK